MIVDPGHGGRDAGARGSGDVLEKEVTLALARKLIEVLNGNGSVRPVLTRRDDYGISLDERAGLANHRGGDLLISLHTGNFFRPVPLGFCLYYWSPASAISTVPSAPEESMSWDLQQFPYWKSSRQLAEVIQKELLRALPWPSGGVNQADLYLLRRVRMPAVLLELGSLGHPEEAAQLEKPAFQQTVARALAEAIRRYADKHEGEAGLPESEPR
ncbi:MAG: N-acetylmuramoyl-L-alanine amidase [Syntrophobacteria bacterium]